MSKKTVTTKTGEKIEVELVRKVQDKVAYMDGANVTSGREIVEYTNITFRDQNGKYITDGKTIEPMYGNNKTAMIAQGAVARIGQAAVTQEIVYLVNAALTELEIENPKTAEYVAIKNAEAKAKSDYEIWVNSDEQIAARKFEREMNNPNSDY